MTSSPSTTATLYLVGFRIEPDIFEPQFYTVYIDDERPIMQAGRPIVFVRPELAAEAWKKCDCGAGQYGPAPDELYAVFDFTDAVHTLATKDECDSDQPLNCINLILDFANCISEKMPKEYRTCLSRLADLTFDSDLAKFFEATGYTRNIVIDAIYWSVGMTLCNVKILASREHGVRTVEVGVEEGSLPQLMQR